LFPDPIVSSPTLVCLVGGASIAKSDVLSVAERVSAYIAVDSGADHLLNAGLTPRAVIGDLDSLSRKARALFADRLCHIEEQSTTDFEKALTRVDAPAVLGIGFTGGRLDHVLSVLNVMMRHPDRPVVLADREDASFLAHAGDTVLDLPEATRVSIMPLIPATVTLGGVVWPFDAQPLAVDGFTSPSNAALGGDVTVRTDAPVLVTLPRAFLPIALQAVSRAG